MWYFCTVAAICALAATGYWFAIRSELNHALDQGLRYRLIGLREFLEDVEPGGDQEIASRLDEISQLGELLPGVRRRRRADRTVARARAPRRAAAHRRRSSDSRFATAPAERRTSRCGSPGRR